MKVRFKFESKFPKLVGAIAVTLYPFVFVGTTPDVALRTHIIAHELVHVAQVRKLGWLKFHALYFWHFLKAFVKSKSWDGAYYQNPYEKEAYKREADREFEAAAQFVSEKHFLP